MSNTITVRVEGALLDQVLVGAFGYAGQSVIEETLALNPGLHTSDGILPLGAVIMLPDKPGTEVRSESAEIVTLFD